MLKHVVKASHMQSCQAIKWYAITVEVRTIHRPYNLTWIATRRQHGYQSNMDFNIELNSPINDLTRQYHQLPDKCRIDNTMPFKIIIWGFKIDDKQ